MNQSFKTPAIMAELRSMLIATLVIAVLVLLPSPAMAQTSGWPPAFVSDIGCTIVQWMKGPLAVLIFVVALVAALVIGLIAKMDWSRIIYLVLIFGIISGLGGLLANNSALQSWSGLSNCLQ